MKLLRHPIVTFAAWLLRHPIVTFPARLVLGGLFIYAAWHKVVDPPDFAKAIYNYKLLPGEYLHLAALFLPWLELLAGLALVIGAGVRGGAATLGLLAAVFIAALSFNLYRGHPTICGCFSTFASGKSLTDAEKFARMWREVFLDFGLLMLAAQVSYASLTADLGYRLCARKTA